LPGILVAETVDREQDSPIVEVCKVQHKLYGKIRETPVFLHSIDLETATNIVDAAIAKGREMEFEPLTVVVLDDSGIMKTMKREDGASLMRPDIAMGKAWGCLGFGFGGRVIAGRAETTPGFVNALIEMSGGRIVASPGGVLIKNGDGMIIGAIGITGDTGENDEICAIAGVEAVGLTADPGVWPQ
jgi:uncharacterized protein GlcG (DUF336 family)